MRRTLPLLALFWAWTTLSAQVNYTANNVVTPYTGKFRTGINMGYYPNWDNQTLGNIAAGNPALQIPGIGAKSNRIALHEIVLDYYGYNLLTPDFQHWDDLGMHEYVAIVGGPTGPHQDYTQFCPGVFSNMFANLYTPIWDGGANGTPYNDDNYFAAYMYKVVSQYKDKVRFWEIWNEPGLDLTGNLGWRDQNYPGNWWLEGPNPCDNIMHAPIYDYIRTLRIAWEVIKTLQPDGYVSLGSVGYQSFLNALLRNTDNPNGGDVTPEYPLGGGAYFDCISFHSYPHFDGSTLNYDAGLFQRHSDRAADGVTLYRDYYQTILDQYGYNGITYPKKEWIVTEINSPRHAYTGPFFSGQDAQINHMMKAQMVAKINKIHQLHTYELFDQQNEQDASYEFHLMGLYKKLNGQGPGGQVVNDEGKGLKTVTDLIYDTEYDPNQTAAMNLPPEVRGYAWKRPDGSYIYALWARTTVDLSEAASATYSFPAAFNAASLTRYDWDYGYTNLTQTVSSQNIHLDARPVFFKTNGISGSCRIGATISDVLCADNRTPSDPSDDTYTFVLTTSGINTSGAWIANINGQIVNGSTGVAITLGPYPIQAGNLSFIVQDAFSASCSIVVQVIPPQPCSGQAPPSTGCPSKSDFPWHDWIARVKTGAIDNPSDKSAYSDFTALTTLVTAGTTQPIELTAGFSWSTFDEYWRVWIDFNHNGVYEPNEVAYEGILAAPAPGTPAATISGLLTIQSTATAGPTRMRVSMKRGAYASSCETLPFGEVEDYSIRINANPGGGGGNPVPYCNSKSDFPWQDWIAGVQAGAINNPSGKSSYSDFTGLSTGLITGQPTPINLTAGYSWETWDEYWKVWIDYNQNGVFEEPGELAYSGVLPKPANGTPTAVLTGSLTVPFGTPIGKTRMRVSMKRNSYAFPCETLPFGEVEDYSVMIGTNVSLSGSSHHDAPVQPMTDITFFDVAKVSDGVRVIWTDYNDAAISRFEVQHSTDGKTWKTLEVVSAQTNLAVARTYEYQDLFPVEGENHYRIVAIPVYQAAFHTPARQLSIRKPETFSLFPNPASGAVTLNLSGFTGRGALLTIYNAQGMKVNEIPVAADAPVMYTLSLEGFPAGQYFILLNVAGGKSMVQKLMVD